MALRSILLALALLQPLLCDTPATWPNLFQENFSEKLSYPVFGSGETTGTIFYDWPNKQYVLTRANGKWDRYCGTVFPFRNTPCEHRVSGGNRYLHFP